jgi:predicted Zn-dependent protease
MEGRKVRRCRVTAWSVSWCVVLLCTGLLSACQTVPVTGRQQLILLSSAEENRLGITSYEQIIKDEKLSTDARINAMVRQVGQRIAAVAARPDFAWEFRVIEKDVANAFALPGGKVAVYTGILKYTKTETGLAVVMGHEIAHAIARHGGERVSRDPAIIQAIGLAYGVGVQLPFSRAQESEADHIGIVLMAKAGYDPREAVPFWRRMAAGKTGQSPPEFLSTHPSGTTRMAQLEQWMPEALQYYKK